MNRIDRLSAILIMLQSSSLVKPKQITERFGIGIRTVYRDIRALEEAGIPITGDSRLGYSLVDGFKLPPLMFSQEEAFAFLAAEKLVNKFTDSGLNESYKSGIDKIRAVMRLAEKETISAIEPTIGNLDFHSTSSKNIQDRLQIILNSISKKKQLLITYISHSKNEHTKRLIDPVGVFFSMANWYLIGYCNKRNDYRTFKVNRIGEIEESEYSIDKIHPPLNQFLQQLKNQTELQEAIIQVKVKDLPIIDESKYYQGLVSEITKNDLIELHFMTFSISRLARWYMSYMDIAEVLYPQELKDKIKKIISKHR